MGEFAKGGVQNVTNRPPNPVVAAGMEQSSWPTALPQSLVVLEGAMRHGLMGSQCAIGWIHVGGSSRRAQADGPLCAI